MVEGESLLLDFNCLITETMAVDSMPVSHCGVCLTVATIKPPTQSKRVAAKRKATSHPMTWPQACKVTWVLSPTLEITEVVVPIPPVSGPSQANQPPLFEEPIASGSEGIRKEAPTTSGEYL